MQEGKYHVVTTKVTPEAKEKLNRIAEAFGISRYQLFQLFALVCVRLWDKPAALSDEHRVLLGEFLHTLAATKGEGFNLLHVLHNQPQAVESAFLFVRTPKAGRPQLLDITHNARGELRESYNLDTMLRRFLHSADPSLLRVLQAEQARRKQLSLFGTLREIIMQRQASAEDVMAEDIAELFADIRTTAGDRPNEDAHFKRVRNHGDYTTHTQSPKKRVLAELR